MYVKTYNNVVEEQRLRISPMVGNKFPKLHGLLHFPWQMERYGSGCNFFGGYLESHLKTFVKHPGKRTRRTHKEFCKDLVNRWSESQHINDLVSTLAQNDVSPDRYTWQSNHAQPDEGNMIARSYDTKVLLGEKMFKFVRMNQSWCTIHGKQTVKILYILCTLYQPRHYHV